MGTSAVESLEHVTVPQFPEEAAEVGKLRPFERVPQQTAERQVELPLMPEATVEVARFTRVTSATTTAEHIVQGSWARCSRAADYREVREKCPRSPARTKSCSAPGIRFSMFPCRK